MLDKTLKELFEMLATSEYFVFQDALVKQDNFVKSIEFTTLYLEAKDPKIIDLFFLIGSTYDGILEADIIEIFTFSQEIEVDIKKRIKTLMQTSLIQKE